MKHIKGLKCDFESGEGEIQLDEKFYEQSWLMQADILQDWINILTMIQANAIVEVDKEYKRIRKEAEKGGDNGEKK